MPGLKQWSARSDTTTIPNHRQQHRTENHGNRRDDEAKAPPALLASTGLTRDYEGALGAQSVQQRCGVRRMEGPG